MCFAPVAAVALSAAAGGGGREDGAPGADSDVVHPRNWNPSCANLPMISWVTRDLQGAARGAAATTRAAPGEEFGSTDASLMPGAPLLVPSFTEELCAPPLLPLLAPPAATSMQ